MTMKNERAEKIADRVEAAMFILKTVKAAVKKGKHVDPSEFSDLNEIIASIRHNCELNNAERLQPK